MRIIAICFFTLASIGLMAQERLKKVEFYGAAKTNILHQSYDVEADTSNITKANYGHSLVDLGILLRPSANTEVAAELRIRNELGGFWGSSVTYGIRRLTLKGVVNDAIRYKIGDLDLKMTPYTVFNNTYQDVVNEATVFQMAREVIDYEYYFTGNSWRQQGIQSDFGFDLNNETFNSLDFNIFSVRNRTPDFNASLPERLFSGGQAALNTTYGSLIYHSANLHDLKNTVNDINLYYNSVNSLSAKVKLPNAPDFTLDYEGGISKANYDNLFLDEQTTIKDYYWNLGLTYKPSDDLKVRVNAINTGPQFRSPAAQTVRLVYSSSSNVFPTIGNELSVRKMGLLDYLYNDVMYNRTFNDNLDEYNPAFSNAMPYGLATPNRKGFSLSLDEYTIKDNLELSSDIHLVSEIIGTGTSNLKSFFKAVAKANYHYKKWSVNAGIAHENTTRDGESFEKVDLTTMLIDFGLDFNVTDKIVVLLGSKYHTANGNELVAVYDNYNNPLIFDPVTFNDNKQSLHSLGMMVKFSERSTLTASASTFSQVDERDYSMNQFQILYRLNF